MRTPSGGGRRAGPAGIPTPSGEAPPRPRLSALDLGPAEDTLRLGPELEAAGYHRHWIAEHQPQPQPLLLAALVAERTRRIRIGTAGILLHFYPPSRTAFDFRFLADRFPERVDAGFCRGRVGGELEVDQLDGRDARAHMDRYPARAAAFVAYLRNGCNGAEPGQRPHPPARHEDPEIWSLGSGEASARLAAEHGLRFAYSLFHEGLKDGPAFAAAYREHFVPVSRGSRPYLAVTATGVCARTDAAAARIAGGYATGYLRPNVVGAPGACLEQLLAVAEPYGPDEVVFTALGGDFEERMAGFRLLAEAWEAA